MEVGWIGAAAGWRAWPSRAARAILTLPPALVLAGFGCAFLAASSDLANTFNSPRQGGPLVAVLLCACLAAAFVCFLLAARRQPLHGVVARWPLLRWLALPLLAWALVTALQTPGLLAHGMQRAVSEWPPRYGSDDLYYDHYNAQLVLRGENPYMGVWLLDEVAYFGAPDYTPLRRGGFADPRHYPSRAEQAAVLAQYQAHPASPPPEIEPRTTHSYPSGAFLVDVPFVWAGLPSVAAPQIALFLAVIAAIVAAAPGGTRLIVALLLLATADGARQVTGGDFEIWPLAAVAGMWLLRDRRWASAVLLGVACALKQTAWLAAPFCLVWVWRERGRDEALRRGALAAGVFVAVNLPWIVASPGAWLASLALPVSLPLLPDGSGIVGLGLADAAPLAPSWVYSALEVIALVAALVWYWRAERLYPFAGLVLPLAPLFFAWRSSERYFVLLPLLGLLAVALTLRTGARAKTPVRAARA